MAIGEAAVNLPGNQPGTNQEDIPNKSPLYQVYMID